MVDGGAVRPGTAQPACHSLKEVPEKLRPTAAALVRETIWEGVRAGPGAPQVIVVDEGFLLLGRSGETAHVVWSLAKRSCKGFCGLSTIT